MPAKKTTAKPVAKPAKEERIEWSVRPYSKGVVAYRNGKELARAASILELDSKLIDANKLPDGEEDLWYDACASFEASAKPAEEPAKPAKETAKGKATVQADVKPAKPAEDKPAGTVPRRAAKPAEGWELPANPLHSFKVLAMHPNAATDTNEKGEIVGFQCLRAVESCTEVCKGGIARRCHAMLALSKREGLDILKDMDTLWDLGDMVDAMSVAAQRKVSEDAIAKLKA